ncbi:hypothetical protein KSC_019150 [Ktedonobacter sp. SOSP1-52]|nr:hypothetical protein KSC_019150 [Ktedonobacter sp. SOSP1-52]
MRTPPADKNAPAGPTTKNNRVSAPEGTIKHLRYKRNAREANVTSKVQAKERGFSVPISKWPRKGDGLRRQQFLLDL